MKYLFPILSLIFLFSSCMPEEELPVRGRLQSEEFFIECYCKPGKIFALAATTIIPLDGKLHVDLLKRIDITILADTLEIPLNYIIFTLPGSDFIYNYRSFEKLSENTGLLTLNITTADSQVITGSTSIPSDVVIQHCYTENNNAFVLFHTSANPEENYYIYTIELLDQYENILENEFAYLDYSNYPAGRLVEKSLSIPATQQACSIRFVVKRLTRDNYNYQISLNAANSAQQSSITSPVPLQGNINGALGIFTCYTEDQKVISLR